MLQRHDYTALEEVYGEMDILETEADRVHRQLRSEVCEGAFFGGIREDLLGLMEKVDDIADSAKDSVKILIQSRVRDSLLDDISSTPDLEGFVESCGKAVTTLREAIDALRKNRESVIKLAEKVEEWEELADFYKFRVLKHLLRNREEIDVLGVIQLQSFINVADNIADGAEDASDILLMLVAKGYG